MAARNSDIADGERAFRTVHERSKKPETEGPDTTILMETTGDDFIELDSASSATVNIKALAGDDIFQAINNGTAVLNWALDGDEGTDTFRITGSKRRDLTQVIALNIDIFDAYG